MSRRTRQQVQQVIGGLLTLMKTIFVNGVLVMLAPVLVPVSLALQLWNSLPTFRQVRRALPTSFSEVRRIPRSVWNSIPSVSQLVNMVVGLLQAMVRDYFAHFSTQGLGQFTRKPLLHRAVKVTCTELEFTMNVAPWPKITRSCTLTNTELEFILNVAHPKRPRSCTLISTKLLET